MRVCVFGAGALGSALGALLTKANEVVLVGREQHVRAIARHGLQLTGARRTNVRVRAYTGVRGLEPPELLIITTKAYDTASAVASCRSLVDDQTMVLTLQNGLGNLELLRDWRGRKAFGGTTTMGATLRAPGRVRIAALGRTVIGADLDPQGARAISRAFGASGIPVSVSRNIQGELWSKAIVNSCINPLTAILRVRNGRLLESEVLIHLMREVCRECEEVARASGIQLPPRAGWARVLSVAKETATNISSMLRDVELGRRTEIEFLNGAFCRLGSEMGVETPLNSVLAAMVSSLERHSHPQKG